MSAPQFVDMSIYQPTTIDWHAYRAWSAQGDGISRVALRSSYGAGFPDAHYHAYRAGAEAAGIEMIFHYHYAYPSLNSAEAEANYQHSIVGAIGPRDLLVLDFEESVPAATAAWAYAWLTRQEANYPGRLPTAIYASDAYIRARLQDSRLARFVLWLANWRFTPDARPPCPPPWTSYAALQYTDKATTIPGVPGIVDADIFLGGPSFDQEKVMLDIVQVASYFQALSSDIWTCTATGFMIGHGLLDFYRRVGGDGLFGLTYLGLPLSNEIAVTGKAGVAYQRYERGVVVWDPGHMVDNPPGAGQAYLLHLDKEPGQDPRIAQLTQEIAALKAVPASADIASVQVALADLTSAQTALNKALGK